MAIHRCQSGNSVLLLEGFTREIFRPECNPNFTSLHCFAHLDQDVGEVIPYLNADLGGFQCTREPPSVTFKIRGRLITIHPRKIAINALKDEEEADRILDWLKRQINETWERRAEITPSFELAPRPQLIEILRLLPRTNCRECGQPTCMVFAARLAEGVEGIEACPAMDEAHREKLSEYLSRFNLDPGF
ncbi:MAG: (Fe-S)-binding protein [Desulfobacterales bacterium]